jgi:hypothetical protein
MSAEETEIHDFLKQFPNLFVSVLEISKRLGNRGRYDRDKVWARPVLRRMEMDGILESNPYGEYRLVIKEGESLLFKQALNAPGVTVPLGDTTIITLDDTKK